MATYAIGDVQGCSEAFEALLARIAFDPHRDTLWLVGDLVNRGPASVAVLRHVRSLGARARMVLGNHDLHLLAVRVGARAYKDSDTFGDVLEAPDCDELLAWLRRQPLLHHDAKLGFTMVHAGLAPQWDLHDAMRHAAELAAVLRGPRYRTFFEHMYGNGPALWDESLQGWKRLRFITNTFTRIRYCDAGGRLRLKPTGPPACEDPALVPWFAVPERKTRGQRIIFGHWATLQMHAALSPEHGVYHIDSGCVWGGCLTALRLDDERYFRVDCTADHQAADEPGS